MKPIDAVLGLYEHRFQTRNAQIFKRYRDTPPVFSLSGEFKQVLSNLALNALDAMPGENPQLVLRVSPAKDWGYSDALWGAHQCDG
jgi:signal transduction histidine kinase